MVTSWSIGLSFALYAGSNREPHACNSRTLGRLGKVVCPAAASCDNMDRPEAVAESEGSLDRYRTDARYPIDHPRNQAGSTANRQAHRESFMRRTLRWSPPEIDEQGHSAHPELGDAPWEAHLQAEREWEAAEPRSQMLRPGLGRIGPDAQRVLTEVELSALEKNRQVMESPLR